MHRTIQRKYFTLEQRTRLIDDYLGSGLTQAQFAIQSGISLASLSRWLRKSQKYVPEAAAAVKFMEVPSGALPVADAPSSAVYQIHFPNGVKVQVGSSFKPSEAGALLRLVQQL